MTLQITLDHYEFVPEGRFINIFTGTYIDPENDPDGSIYLPTSCSEYYSPDYEEKLVEVYSKNSDAHVESLSGMVYSIGSNVYLSNLDGLVSSDNDDTGIVVGRFLEQVSDDFIRIILI